MSYIVVAEQACEVNTTEERLVAREALIAENETEAVIWTGDIDGLDSYRSGATFFAWPPVFGMNRDELVREIDLYDRLGEREPHAREHDQEPHEHAPEPRLVLAVRVARRACRVTARVHITARTPPHNETCTPHAASSAPHPSNTRHCMQLSSSGVGAKTVYAGHAGHTLHCGASTTHSQTS